MDRTDQECQALEVVQVSHSFGQNLALDAVSFRIAPGKFCALLGLNGAGKTTLFASITRLYDTRGCIKVFGFDIRTHPTLALQHLGVVFQSRTVDPDLTVLQNMLYHASLHGMPKAQAIRQADQELERVDLKDRKQEKTRTLSGGQVRRLEIARALMHQPRLLLLDEPTAGLDFEAREDILTHVRRLVREDGIGVLWATHLIDEIKTTDDVVILHKGRVLGQGAVKNVLKEMRVKTLATAFNKVIA